MCGHDEADSHSVSPSPPPLVQLRHRCGVEIACLATTRWHWQPGQQILAVRFWPRAAAMGAFAVRPTASAPGVPSWMGPPPSFAPNGSHPPTHAAAFYQQFQQLSQQHPSSLPVAEWSSTMTCETSLSHVGSFVKERGRYHPQASFSAVSSAAATVRSSIYAGERGAVQPAAPLHHAARDYPPCEHASMGGGSTATLHHAAGLVPGGASGPSSAVEPSPRGPPKIVSMGEGREHGDAVPAAVPSGSEDPWERFLRQGLPCMASETGAPLVNDEDMNILGSLLDGP